MAKAKDAVTELAEKLVRALEAQRARGDGAYPLTLKRLGELADSQATSEQLRKALGKKPCKERVVVGQKKNDAAPAALAEDADRLAGSTMLLEFVLEQVCTAEKPVVSLASAKAKVDGKLRPMFEREVNRRAADDTLPSSVGSVTVRGKPHLYLRRMPPPPPPKKPEVELAEKLTRALESQRLLGADAYPCRLDRLLDQADPQAPPRVVTRALKEFEKGAVLACKGRRDTLVALADDAGRLASSARLLEALLAVAKTEATQAFTADELKKKLTPSLREPFAAATAAGREEGTLPPTVGCVKVKNKPLFFLLGDATVSRVVVAPQPQPSRGAVPAPVAPPPTDFARTFAEAFDRLDRRDGGFNFVNLRDLRRELPADRETFDAELHRLRAAGRYSLSAAEGRHGVSPEERQAGIDEGGALLLFVSRKTP